jgi:hypothetical protein
LDNNRFDSLTKLIALGGNRRRFLAGIGSVALGLTGAGTAEAARSCTAVGTICRKDGNCCSGLCSEKDRQGRQRCACQIDTDCPSGNACSDNGVCFTVCTTPAGTLCTSPSGTPCDCDGLVCAGGLSPSRTCQDCSLPMTASGAYCQTEPGNQCCDGNPGCFVGVKVVGGDLACFSTGTCRPSNSPCVTDSDCGGALVCAVGAPICGCTGATPTFCGTPCGTSNL